MTTASRRGSTRALDGDPVALLQFHPLPTPVLQLGLRLHAALSAADTDTSPSKGEISLGAPRAPALLFPQHKAGGWRSFGGRGTTFRGSRRAIISVARVRETEPRLRVLRRGHVRVGLSKECVARAPDAGGIRVGGDGSAPTSVAHLKIRIYLSPLGAQSMQQIYVRNVGARCFQGPVLLAAGGERSTVGAAAIQPVSLCRCVLRLLAIPFRGVERQTR